MASICSLLSPHLIKNPMKGIRIPNPSDWIPKATCSSSRASEPLYSFLNPRRRTLWISTVAAEVLASIQGQEVAWRLYMGNIPRTLGNDELASIFGENGSVEKAERMVSFSFLKASILANTLMLILPLKALAETCEGDNSFFKMPLLFVIALIGATVGGLLARQRKGELRRLNDQLRQINAALRRQAKIESYAPNLSYAPVGRMAETEVIVDPRKQQLITNLRTGKNYLRNQDPEKAFAEFRAALELAQDLGDHVEEKKAARGLGASLQRQGKYREAIKYHSRVLETCKQAGEDSGSTEALGAIADCYTELGDLEQAGKYYDEYIARLRTD